MRRRRRRRRRLTFAYKQRIENAFATAFCTLSLSAYVCECVYCCHIFQVSNEQIAYHVPVSIPKVYLHVLVGVLKIAEMPPLPAWMRLALQGSSSAANLLSQKAAENPPGICGNCRHDFKFLMLSQAAASLLPE